MNKKIIVINGPGRSGKDSFIRMVRLFLQGQGIKVYSFTSIFPIKKKLIDEKVWDGVSEKNTAIRKTMAQFKEAMTNNGNQPNKYLINSIEKVEDNSIIFVHIREAKNINSFIEMFNDKFGENPLTMHLERKDPNVEIFHSGVDLVDETREFKNYDFDIIIKQYGLEFLREEVRNFLNKDLNLKNLSEFDLDELLDIKPHKNFDDQLKAGII